MVCLKRKILLFTVFCFLIVSCSEDESSTIVSEKATVSFAPILNDLLRSQENKQQDPDLPACSDNDDPAYVEIVLLQGEDEIVGSSDSPFTIDVVSGENYTEYAPELELEPGTYSLDHFSVYNSDDDLIWIAPRGEALENLVESTLPLPIELDSGVKKYVDVPVLCFDDRMVNEYGYLFFDLIPTETYEFCFFANYCNEAGRHYPAAYSVDVWLGTDNTGTPLYSDVKNNLSPEGEEPSAAPLCIELPNLSEFPDDKDYIYYEVNLLSWSDVYGEVSSSVINGTLNRNNIESNFDGDSNVEYEHLAFGCGDEDVDCDVNNPLDDCDNDGVVNEIDNCPGTPAGIEVDENGCENIQVPGRDIVVFNDVNLFVEPAMDDPDNVKLVQNLVNFETTGERADANTVWIDRGRDIPCTSECGDAAFQPMFDLIESEGHNLELIFSSSGSLVDIPSEVKSIFLILPIVQYTVSEINALKSFAAEGGRIIFVGEYEGYYGTGISLENQFLLNMGSELYNTGGEVDCGSLIQLPNSSLRSHPITEEIKDLSFGCASVIEPGESDFPLFYDTTNTHVLGGVTKIDTSPISELKAYQSKNKKSYSDDNLENRSTIGNKN